MIFMLTAVSCAGHLSGGVDSILVNPSKEYVPVPNEEVRIILDPDQLQHIRYDVVARLSVSSKGGMFYLKGADGNAELTEKLRTKAGEIGANAILDPEVQTSGMNAAYTRVARTMAIYIYR